MGTWCTHTIGGIGDRETVLVSGRNMWWAEPPPAITGCNSAWATNGMGRRIGIKSNELLVC